MITVGAVGRELEAKPAAERAAIKVAAFTALEPPKPYEYEYKAKPDQDQKVTITIRSIGEERGLLRLELEAEQDGKPVDMSAVNPVYVHNPPICVPDGTTSVVEVATGKSTRQVELANFREDLPAALCEIAGQVVAIALQQEKRIP